MAYPALIQKILDMRLSVKKANLENERLCVAIAKLSTCQIRMCTRLSQLEIAKISENPDSDVISEDCCNLPTLDPSGCELSCGARVAPITLIEKSAQHHPGAALTVVVDAMDN